MTARELFYARSGDVPFALEAMPVEGGVKPPEWVHILPAPDKDGKIYSRDYRVLEVDSLEDVAKRSNDTLARQKGGAPVDKDHEIYGGWFDTGGGPVLAWAEEFEARSDGLYARVDWLPEGAELVTSKRYRYTSSVLDGTRKWEFNDEGWPEKLVLVVDIVSGFGITNIPALETTSMFTVQGDDAMKIETLKAIAQHLGIPDDATPEQARAAFTTYRARLTVETPPAEPKADPVEETEEEQTPEVTEPDKPAEQAEPDGETVESLRRQLAERDDTIDKLRRAAAESYVAQLCRDGKLTPAQKKAALSMAAKPGGVDDLRALYDNAPRLLHGNRPEQQPETPESHAPSGVDPLAYKLAGDPNNRITDITTALKRRQEKQPR